MSVTLAPPSAPRERQPYGRRRGRASRPGVSLMAQGEPMIWLTGGALVTCVTMIVGLLSMILWYGIPTFWPTPLVLLETQDGGKVLGEVSRVDKYILSKDNLVSLSDAERQIAEKLLAGTDRSPVRRRLIRNGNFELSGEHFRWVNDFFIKPGGETLPEWAVMIERMEWGRFYGEPQQFIARHERPIQGDEQELVRILQFLEANQWRAAAEQAESIEKALTAVRDRLAKLRETTIERFVEAFKASGPADYVAVLDDGQAVPLADRPPQANVSEVREIWKGASTAWPQFERHHPQARRRFYQRRELERDDVGTVNRRLEDARLDVRRAELEHGVTAMPIANELNTLATTINGIRAAADDAAEITALAQRKFLDNPAVQSVVKSFADAQQQEIAEQLREPERSRTEWEGKLAELPPAAAAVVRHFLQAQQQAEAEITEIQKEINDLQSQNNRLALLLTTAEGQETSLALADIVRAFPANQLSWTEKLGVYGSRWWEYLTDEPREANSEGGVLPAIWGTVVMTVIMSLLVVPFGVLAALYLREYARAGLIVSVIRVSISNLAGVPSIVFGVFGLGFFCYLVGAYVDGGPVNAGLDPLPPGIWWVSLFALAVMALAAFLIGLVLISGQHGPRRNRHRWLGYASLILWLGSVSLAVLLIARVPFFDGLYTASLPNPTFGKQGLIWASLTLSLLTLPVVIVATEEALASVPNSLREGSFACGASKWQTIRRIILPHAMPGIMTGMILAMARGAGEVAPLMLVGAVKLQPELPVDMHFPFVHFSRSFMHLGFHIFDLGFQSQNSEAAKPMVFTTTMLLIVIIATLNLAAIWIRSKLRKRFQMGQF